MWVYVRVYIYICVCVCLYMCLHKCISTVFRLCLKSSKIIYIYIYTPIHIFIHSHISYDKATILLPSLFKLFSIKLVEELLGRIMYLWGSFILLEGVFNIEQVLAAAPHKAPTVRSPTKYHERFHIDFNLGGARGVVVIAVGNEHGNTSSNPGRD